jgi:hypothetical protein
MEKNSEFSIDQLKACLNEQLEAYWKENWQEYGRLEKKILEIEKFI